jgi:segregation and condensation protein B
MSKRKGRKPPLTSEIKSVMRAPPGGGKELEPSIAPELAPELAPDLSSDDEALSDEAADGSAAALPAEFAVEDEAQPESGPTEPESASLERSEAGASDTDHSDEGSRPSDERAPSKPRRSQPLRAVRGRQAAAEEDEADEPARGDDDEPTEGGEQALRALEGLEPSADARPEREDAEGAEREAEGDDTGVYGAFSLEGFDGDDTEGFLRGLVEALLFTSQKPLDLKDLARTAGIDRPRAKELVEQLQRSYEGGGLCIEEVAGGFVMRSAPRYAPHIQKILSLRPVRLSRAQLETLAIVAYRQPVTKPEVDDIRGVDSGQVIKGLLERALLKMLGKKDEPGRPTLYGTTNDFLELLNLQSLKDLPTLREYTELSEESQRKFLDETGEAAPADAFSFERPAGSPGDAQGGLEEGIPEPDGELRGTGAEDENAPRGGEPIAARAESPDPDDGEATSPSDDEAATADESAELASDVPHEGAEPADDDDADDEDDADDDADDDEDADDDDDDDADEEDED